MQRYLQEEDREISQQRMELCCYLQLLTSDGLVRGICHISRHSNVYNKTFRYTLVVHNVYKLNSDLQVIQN